MRISEISEVGGRSLYCMRGPRHDIRITRVGDARSHEVTGCTGIGPGGVPDRDLTARTGVPGNRT